MASQYLWSQALLSSWLLFHINIYCTQFVSQRTGTKAEKSGDDKAYGNLGIAYDSRGHFKAAVDYHERILEISRELGDKWNEGAAYGNLGNAYYSLGDFKTAIHYHKRRLEIAEKLGDRSGQGKAYCNLGNAHGLSLIHI